MRTKRVALCLIIYSKKLNKNIFLEKATFEATLFMPNPYIEMYDYKHC